MVRLDAGTWLHHQDFVLAMWNALALPTYCPPEFINLDSFLIDENPDVGLAVSIDRFDEFFKLEPEVAWQILDMFARHSRHASLARRLWIVLLGTGGKYLKIRPVGASNISNQ